MKARLLIGTHGRFENGQNRLYRPNDELELNEAEALALAGRFEVIMDDAPEPPVAPIASLLDGNVRQVREAVAAIDSRADLALLMATEESDRDRKGALRAIQERMDELNG